MLAEVVAARVGSMSWGQWKDLGVGQGAWGGGEDSFLATLSASSSTRRPPPQPRLQAHPQGGTGRLFPCSWARCHWLLDITFCIYQFIV